MLVVERDTPCMSIVHTAGGGKRYTLHVHNCWLWKGIHPHPYCWWWKGIRPARSHCWWWCMERDTPCTFILLVVVHGKRYTLHLHTAGYTLHVKAAGSGNGYTQHVKATGIGKRYTLHVKAAGIGKGARQSCR
jgi:hypothetical protein